MAVGLEINWYLPSHGDSHHLVHGSVNLPIKPDPNQTDGIREPALDHLVDIARAAEYAGIHAMLVPMGSTCHDPWLLTAALAEKTESLRFLIAFRPGFTQPAQAVLQVKTLQAISRNRILLHAITGDSSTEPRKFGDFADHTQRYARTAEFLSLFRRLARGESFEYSGEYFSVDSRGYEQKLETIPTIYFEGSTAAAEDVASLHADVYLQGDEPPAMLAERVHRLREKAWEAGRTLRFGYRVHVIARQTEEEAWCEAERLLEGLTPESAGQAHMRSLHQSIAYHNARDLEIYPNLWAGVGLARDGAGTALVGSYQQVAERIMEFHAAGMDHFILSGYPNLEEVLRFGSEIQPLLGDSAYGT